MTSNPLKPILIYGHTKDYAWGQGQGSIVQRLSNVDLKLSHYAEIWFGDHPSGSSLLVENKLALKELVGQNSDKILGEDSVKRFGRRLPFLFKFLSIAKPLSIQAHPNAKQAEILHSKKPALYPDPYPKPEVGIALEDVQLLYGFRSVEEIAEHLDKDNHNFIPEFRALFSTLTLEKLESCKNNPQAYLRLFYQDLFKADSNNVREQCINIFNRLSKKSNLNQVEQHILNLQKDFPEGDVGLFSFFCLNLICLKQYEAIFIGPGIPHAYLSGQLAECMSASDNVVRAGLTIKPIDLDSLFEILIFNPTEARIVTALDNSALLNTIRTNQDYFSIEIIKNQSKSFNVMGPELIVPLDNQISVECEGYRTIALPGQAVLIPFCISQYSVHAENALCFRVYL